MVSMRPLQGVMGDEKAKLIAELMCVCVLQPSDSAKRLKDLVDNERKGSSRTTRESEDMTECNLVFKDF
jgi:hypothetical protein